LNEIIRSSNMTEHPFQVAATGMEFFWFLKRMYVLKSKIHFHRVNLVVSLIQHRCSKYCGAESGWSTGLNCIWPRNGMRCCQQSRNWIKNYIHLFLYLFTKADTNWGSHLQLAPHTCTPSYFVNKYV
jgi:hypothetical protein